MNKLQEKAPPFLGCSHGIIQKCDRSKILNQTPCCIWLTGLSGAGKSTLAHAVEQHLHLKGRHVYVLDGDNIRHGLSKDLGFSIADRQENIRRIAEVARLMVDAGLIVIVAFISPFRSDRAMARSLFDKDEFLEVFVDTPLDICEQRDIKGLYHKARRGELDQFTGISSPYEQPETPDIHIHMNLHTINHSVEQILERLI